MKNIAIILLLSCLFFGCEKAFLGTDETNDPINNFELFWNDFDQHYGLFQARGWDWDSIYTVYQPQVDAQTSDAELWGIFKDMIGYLDDSHTFVAIPPPNQKFFASGSEGDSIVAEEVSIDLLKSSYLENVKDIPNTDEEYDFIYGNLQDKDIGYIYLKGIETSNNDFMDEVLQDIGKHKAIILDLRSNFGGDDVTAEAIAGRFADGNHFVYTVQERNGPEHTDFTDKIEYYTGKIGSEHFSKPLIVLTDQNTVSAAEILLLHLKSFDQVTQIGTPTSGDFSDISMRRFLPNGWQYQFSIMMFLLPDGSSLDGIGHIPDIAIRNSIPEIEAGEDKVLERAISFLWDEYGIE